MHVTIYFKYFNYNAYNMYCDVIVIDNSIQAKKAGEN